MNMFREVVLWLAIFSVSFSIICMAISFGQYFARKSKIFEQYIKNGWIALNKNKFFEQYIKNGWTARNFDWIAIVMLSIFVLGVLVYSAELLDLIKSQMKKYDTIRNYVFNNPSEMVALLVFLILLMRRWIARNFDTTALLVSIPALIWFFDPLSGYWTIRSFVEYNTLLIGALLGFPILIKRVDTSQETLKETQKQSRTSQYRDARDLLNSDKLNLRMMGIADLRRFAQTHPQEEYHNVMNVFASFIKNPIPYGVSGIKAGKREDINAILNTFKKSLQKMMGKEFMKDTEAIDLTDADLQEAELRSSNLKGVCLLGANLSGAMISNSDLIGAHLGHTDLSGADLIGSDLSGSHFYLAIINGTNFLDVKNLTQEQFDDCVLITDHPVYGQPSFLPDDIKPNYPNMSMSMKEWKDKCKESRESRSFASMYASIASMIASNGDA